MKLALLAGFGIWSFQLLRDATEALLPSYIGLRV